MKSFFLFTATALIAASAFAQGNVGSTSSDLGTVPAPAAQATTNEGLKSQDHEVGSDRQIEKEEVAVVKERKTVEKKRLK